jgi:hypothetical protein
VKNFSGPAARRLRLRVCRWFLAPPLLNHHWPRVELQGGHEAALDRYRIAIVRRVKRIHQQDDFQWHQTWRICYPQTRISMHYIRPTSSNLPHFRDSTALSDHRVLHYKTLRKSLKVSSKLAQWRGRRRAGPSACFPLTPTRRRTILVTAQILTKLGHRQTRN